MPYSKLKVRNAAPVRIPSDLDVAWIAGLYEGEGSCNNIKGRSLAVIYQKDPEILFWCRELFGGRITEIRVGTDKNCHVWAVNGDHARVLLQAIYPFLSSRRKVQLEAASIWRFTGVTGRNTRPILNDERKAARSVMTLKQKMVESQLHYKATHSATVMAYQRDFARQAREKAKQLKSSPVMQKEQYDA